MPEKIVFKQLNVDPSLAYLTMIGLMANMQGWTLKKTVQHLSDYLNSENDKGYAAFAETLKAWDPADCEDIALFSATFLVTVYEWIRMASKASDREAAAIIMHIGEHLPEVAEAMGKGIFGSALAPEGPTRKSELH